VPKEKADALLRVVNKRIAPYVVKDEWYATRLIMFGGGTDGGAIKKRYAAMKDDGELVVKGLEMVRNDWSPWARDFQERLLRVILVGPVETVGIRLNEAIAAEREAFFSGKVPVEDVAITKSIDTEKEYKVKTQHLKAYEKLKDKQSGVIGFVKYWVTAKGETIVQNEETDEEIRAKLDWNAIWKKQAEPIVQRLKTCYQKPPKTLEVWLEPKEA
jgi:DNA polymerase, archaea type